MVVEVWIINLGKMVHITNNFSKIDLICGNIVLLLVTTDKLIVITARIKGCLMLLSDTMNTCHRHIPMSSLY